MSNWIPPESISGRGSRNSSKDALGGSALDTAKERLISAFLSPSEPRLRAGWRLLVQAVLQLVMTACAGIVLVIARPRILADPAAPQDPLDLGATQLAQFAAVTLSIFTARRLLDRRSFLSLGLQPSRQAYADFAAGLLITLIMMGFIFAVGLQTGWVEVDRFGWHSDPWSTVLGRVLWLFAICMLVGWNEELMSRGYHMQTLTSGISLAWGWILSSVVFGALHLANPHATLLAAGGTVLAGLFLGFGYLRTGQLWLSMGLHTGWNFFEGVVFGFPVSGLTFYRLVRVTVHGPVIWTGGDFGPEAGLIVVPALAVGFGLIAIGTRKRQVA